MIRYNMLIAVFLFSVLPGITQSRVEVVIPTAEMESRYIWRNLNDLPFFDRNGYQLNLPQTGLFAELQNKARTGSLNETDYEPMARYFCDSIYRPGDYTRGVEKIAASLPGLEQMTGELEQAAFPWGFETFRPYRVILTLYGPGGSYDPGTGSITLFTTRDGRFKQYNDPSCTLIHEIIHIGIEKPVIQKYNVPHAMKERIVDTFVMVWFSDMLPAYRLQDMGEYRTDLWLTTREDFMQLPAIVESIVNNSGTK